jgi:integrase
LLGFLDKPEKLATDWKQNRMNPSRKPQVVRRGSVAVKIYTVNNRSGGTDYRQFVLAYRNPEGKRVTRKFSDGEEARTEAELAATKLASGEADVLTLSSLERGQYLRAKPILEELGVPLLAAIEDYAAARKLLPKDVSLLTAMEAFRIRHSVGDRTLTVAEAVERYVEDRRKAGCTEVPLRQLPHQLNPLGAMFRMPLADLSPARLKEFLEIQRTRGGLVRSRRTQRNTFKAARAFLRFAVKQKWVSHEWKEDLEAMELPGQDLGTIAVFTPAELARLLETAAEHVPDLLPYLLLGAFAGLRTAELHRLDWAHLDFGEGYVEVTARNAKVKGRRRLVPMSENLKAWLEPLAKEHGLVLPGTARLDWLRHQLVSKTGVAWKPNGLRHSFISYRCAVTKNVAQVAYEAGNSPSIIHTHYLNFRKETEAVAWFNLRPSSRCESVAA